jgi:rhodanese-related sulfurtransferase
MSDLTPEAASELLREPGTQLIDVRTIPEHAAARIAGDLHIELDHLPAQAGSLDRERPVIFYCKTGARSALATDAFRGAGYDAHNLAGGIEAWAARGLPVEAGDGGSAAH